jgi:hypothetical protein
MKLTVFGVSYSRKVTPRARSPATVFSMSSISKWDDLFGCGTLGEVTHPSCVPLDRWSKTLCGMLANPLGLRRLVRHRSARRREAGARCGRRPLLSQLAASVSRTVGSFGTITKALT